MASETDKKKPIGEVTLLNVIASYPHYFKKHASVKTATPKYSGAFIIDPSTKEGKANDKRIRAAMAEAEEDKFGKTGLRYKADRCAYGEGNDKVSQKTDEVPPEYVDMMVLTAKNDERPTTVDRRRRPVTEEDGVFYGGCIVNAVCRFYGIDDADKGGNGLFCSLEGVQYVAEGERFGAAPLSADAFSDLDGDGDEGDGEEFPDDDDDPGI